MATKAFNYVVEEAGDKTLIWVNGILFKNNISDREVKQELQKYMFSDITSFFNRAMDHFGLNGFDVCVSITKPYQLQDTYLIAWEIAAKENV